MGLEQEWRVKMVEKSLPDAGAKVESAWHQTFTKSNFPKLFRLLNKNDFRGIQGGKRESSRDFVLFYKWNDLGHFRLGISVRKKLGNAVYRNKIKRCIKEYFRSNKEKVPQIDVNIIMKQNIKNLNLGDFKMNLKKSLDRIQSINEKHFNSKHQAL